MFYQKDIPVLGRLQDVFAGSVMLPDVWEVPGVEVLGCSLEPLPSNWCMQENICLRKSCCIYLKGNNVGWAILAKPDKLPRNKWVSCVDLSVTANLFEGGEVKIFEVGFEVKISSFPWGNTFEVLSSRVLWQRIQTYAIYLYFFCVVAEVSLRGKVWRSRLTLELSCTQKEKILFYGCIWGLCVALGELIKVDSRCYGLVRTIQKGPVV